jgi:D-glycero-beta-D-manno-heptose-7-phosphate kinase
MKLEEIFKAFDTLKVLIIGDVMIDNYYWGKVDRISPEAPVPVVSLTKKESRMGGAANVAINIKSLGATPILCSVIGDDLNSRLFYDLLEKEGLSNSGIIKSKGRITTVKTRIVGNNYHMLRIDEEDTSEIQKQESDDLIEAVRNIIDSEKIDVIIFEDYDKGVINRYLIKEIVSLGKNKNIPVTADPKRRNFNDYLNVSLIKPNLKELREGLNVELSSNDFSAIKEAVELLKARLKSDTVLVTLSENGVYFSNSMNKKLIPAHVRNISDVSGAGDTVISVASLCLALKLDMEKTATLANLAGGLVCEKVGVIPVDKEQFFKEANRIFE